MNPRLLAPTNVCAIVETPTLISKVTGSKTFVTSNSSITVSGKIVVVTPACSDEHENSRSDSLTISPVETLWFLLVVTDSAPVDSV